MRSKRNRKWHKGWEQPQGWVCPAVGWVLGHGAGPWGRDKERALALALQGGNVAWDGQLQPPTPGMDGKGSKHQHRSAGNCHHWSCGVRLLRLGFLRGAG